MTQNRKESRKVIVARAEVHWQDTIGNSCMIPAMIEDSSHGGMSVRIKKPISVGSKLEIRWYKEQIQGVVRNCRKDGFEYLLGVQRDLQQ